jgi:hypothetical protein
MAIEEVYLSDIEHDDPKYVVRFVAVLKGEKGHLDHDVLHMEICEVESTFSRTQHTAVGADPKVNSDSNFEYNKSMFTLNLDEVIDTLQMLKKYGV